MIYGNNPSPRLPGRLVRFVGRLLALLGRTLAHGWRCWTGDPRLLRPLRAGLRWAVGLPLLCLLGWALLDYHDLRLYLLRSPAAHLEQQLRLCIAGGYFSGVFWHTLRAAGYLRRLRHGLRAWPRRWQERRRERRLRVLVR
ncbi:hypothetical protein [Pseudomonas sp. NW5]|uniref:hypothetical protein n=1 Tax=Pseudomonas sp. NW5 TaxID=2934934 RepID=UPI00201FC773|nr:hypothetical protein [Pseudomonas sp. NW5]MCL7461306.1 hypothetical protein [Pseudomonas sp. NW5]